MRKYIYLCAKKKLLSYQEPILEAARLVLYDDEVKWIANLDDITTKPVEEPATKPVVRLKQEKINKKAE